MRAEDIDRSGTAPARCPYPWCSTAHGATIHPDDEEHRSAGVSVDLVHRRGATPRAITRSTVEIGLVRRATDEQVWLAIDDGQSVDVEVPALLVRDIVSAVVRLDPAVAAELGLEA